MPKRVDARYWVMNEDGSYTRRPPDQPVEVAEEEEEVEATEAATELAEELGVDLGSVEGSGKDGKITVGDVKAASDA